MKDYSDQELIERLLSGGPRQSDNAYHDLSRRIWKNGLDPRKSLPSLENVECPKLKAKIKYLFDTSDIKNAHIPNLETSLMDRSRAGGLLVNIGNNLSSSACQKLLSIVENYLTDNDTEIAGSAAYTLWAWSKRTDAPDLHSQILLEALTDSRNSLSGMIGERIKYALQNIILNKREYSAETAASLKNYLSHRNSKVRERAGELLTVVAIDQGALSDKSILLTHKNAAVKRGAIAGLSEMHFFHGKTKVNSELENRASSLMTGNWSRPNRAERFAIAQAMIKAFVDSRQSKKMKKTKEVKEIEKKLYSGVEADVIEASSSISSLAIDMNDCRLLAPLLGMLLCEENHDLRRASAQSLYYINDLQGTLPIVRCSSRIAQEALKIETDVDIKEVLAAIKIQ